jgi:predicted AAA+ superfamily ATPase
MDSKEEMLLDDHKGAAVETMAVSELLKTQFNAGKKSNLTFFRDKNGFEVDTIADWKHTFAIEVKSNSNTEKKLSSNVRKYVELRSDAIKGIVCYLGELTCEVNGVQYISWKDWGTL